MKQQSYAQIPAAVSTPWTGFSDEELRSALNRWRLDVLGWLGREMLKTSTSLTAAQDGLAIAHRNPGEVAEDLIEILWSKLNEKAVLIERLDYVVHRIEEMDLPHLLILFQRTKKLKVYPWEGAAWELPSSML